eukprot:m.184388 g.184388  ORF g.184388 m.184388 type:complete len:470 (+) comp10508_c0_seq2:418-1827(+)
MRQHQHPHVQIPINALLAAVLLLLPLQALSTAPECPPHAMLAPDDEGRLLVCPPPGGSVVLGGGVSARIAELEDSVTRLQAQNAALRAATWAPLSSGVQHIVTGRAFRWKYFEIDGDHFLAAAILYNGQFVVESFIFKYDNVTGMFDFNVPWQSVTTLGARDWEYFEIDGDHFLAVGNCINDDNNPIIESHIYQFDAATRKFNTTVPWQSIVTKYVFDLEFFNIAGTRFLAVANSYDGMNYTIDSHIYKYNSFTRKFDTEQPWQAITTQGASKLTLFEMDNSYFLAIACFRAAAQPSNYTTQSLILKYSIAMHKFSANSPFQRLPTTGAKDIEYFEIDGQRFLAVANQRTVGTIVPIESYIYKYNNDTGIFDTSTPWQTIVTNSAGDWEHFEVGGHHYLALAQATNMQNAEPSYIYRYDAVSQRFDNLTPFASATLVGAAHWHSFSIGRRFFLAAACSDISYVFVSELP